MNSFHLKQKLVRYLHLSPTEELSEGGNVLFIGENDENVWFAIDKGKTRVSAKIGGNVKGYKNLLSTKEGLEILFFCWGK